MAKTKGQVVPPELQEKFYRMFNTRTDNVVTAHKGRAASPSEKQRQIRESFIRCTVYWNQLTEQEKANLFNRAQKEGRGYFNYFMSQILKKRIKGEVSKYGVKVESFIAPGPDPAGIIYHDDNLFIADRTENRIYRLNMEYEIIEILDLVDITPQGLTITTDYLWVTDGSTDHLYKYDFAGSLVETKNINSGILEAITADKNLLYIYDSEIKRIISYNPDTDQVQEIFKNNSNPIYGLGWDGLNLWYSSYQIDPNQETNFNLQGQEPIAGNNVKYDLKLIDNRNFYLCRPIVENNEQGNQGQLLINQMNIRLFNLCIDNGFIYTTDPESGSGYKIRLVVDMP